MWRKSVPEAETRVGGYSLRKRLLIRLFGALALLTAGLFAFVDAYAQRAADSAYDQLLQAAALSIADTVRVESGQIAVDLPYSSLSILAMARRDRIFYRIDAPGGGLVTGYGDLPVTLRDAGDRRTPVPERDLQGHAYPHCGAGPPDRPSAAFRLGPDRGCSDAGRAGKSCPANPDQRLPADRSGGSGRRRPDLVRRQAGAGPIGIA